MAFMILEINFFWKKNELSNFAFVFFFVYLLPSFINEWRPNTLLVFMECAIEHIYLLKPNRGKVGL